MLMIRDIHQLRHAPTFGVTAVEGLLSVEEALYQALRFVPYCNEHFDVWSPQFTGIILDAASQIDSLWKATASINVPSSSSDKLNITDHYNRFGGLVARQNIVFFGGASPVTICPFHVWQNGTFSSPDWWASYNKLKHDRFSHQAEARLDHAVNAVGALLLAVIYSGSCDVALISARLLDPASSNPWAFTNTGLLRDVRFECRAIIETKLFTHPLGVFGVDDCHLSNYWMSASPRFNSWWALNADKFTKPLATP